MYTARCRCQWSGFWPVWPFRPKTCCTTTGFDPLCGDAEEESRKRQKDSKWNHYQNSIIITHITPDAQAQRGKQLSVNDKNCIEFCRICFKKTKTVTAGCLFRCILDGYKKRKPNCLLVPITSVFISVLQFMPILSQLLIFTSNQHWLKPHLTGWTSLNCNVSFFHMKSFFFFFHVFPFSPLIFKHLNHLSVKLD